MKHQPIAPPRIHPLGCGCWDCNPRRELDARRILFTAGAAFIPVVGLLVAGWTMLPR
jgi:hypothetical protein